MQDLEFKYLSPVSADEHVKVVRVEIILPGPVQGGHSRKSP